MGFPHPDKQANVYQPDIMVIDKNKLALVIDIAIPGIREKKYEKWSS